MNISIFSGGRGSDGLQREFYNKLGKVPTNIVNLYDDGKSTGIVRDVFGTLGPSDLRKCQTLKAKLEKSCNEDAIEFLEYRFSGSSSELATVADRYLKFLEWESPELLTAVPAFLELCDATTFVDFSIANILYAYLFRLSGPTMTEKYFRKLLGLKSKTLISSRSNDKIWWEAVDGTLTRAEHAIVDWNNSDNRIRSFSFKNDVVVPSSTINAILNSDIIVFSTGTVWSSIFPSLNVGIVAALKKTKAKIFVVLNSYDDGDSLGYSTDDYKVEYSKQLSSLKFRYIEATNDNVSSDGGYLWEKIVDNIIFETIASKLENKTAIVSDFDGTLSKKSISYFDDTIGVDKFIVTGNILNIESATAKDIKEVYFNCGTESLKAGYTPESLNFSNELYMTLKGLLPLGTEIVQHRRLWRIKPVSKRRKLIQSLNPVLSDYGLEATIRGKTTIEIHRKFLDKIDLFLSDYKNCLSEILYIGDEPQGNDKKAMTLFDSITIDNDQESLKIFETIKNVIERRRR